MLVFVGVTTWEYARRQDHLVAPEDISAYSVQGLALNAIPGIQVHPVRDGCNVFHLRMAVGYDGAFNGPRQRKYLPSWLTAWTFLPSANIGVLGSSTTASGSQASLCAPDAPPAPDRPAKRLPIA